jgi:ABC-type multidrug transport system fused ATPase/permease subunit
VALGGIFGTRRVLDRHAESAGRELYKLQTEESKVAIDAIDGLKVVKSHAAEDRIGRRLRALLQGEVRPSLQLAFFRYLPSFLNEFAASVIVLLLGALAVFRPSLGLSFPILVGFLMAIRQCGASIANINANIVELQTLRRSVEITSEVLESAPSERSGVRTIDRIAKVQLENVSVQYSSDSVLLSAINLTLIPGTITAIVGPTGAGKSTIAHLIAGLVLPTSGGLTVNGIDFRDLNLTEWRKKIGFVEQNVFLFNSSIRDNIALWMEGVSQADIQAAARLAQLHDFVASLPEGYDTVVGDRGLRLSGGECQRIAIARAVLVRPQILVLDEATSALDNLTEKAVYQAINALRGEAIVLSIAHRLSAIKDADQIVVVESGRIVQSGTHASLMTEGGHYSKLFEFESVRSDHH